MNATLLQSPASIAAVVTFALLGASGSLWAEDRKPRVRDAATDSELLRLYQQSAGTDPIRDLGAPHEPAPGGGSMDAPKDILASSDVLCNLNRATLIPKRALLHVPERFSDRIGLDQGARIQPFQEFLDYNRTWLTTYEVSRAQAEGREVIDPEKLERFIEMGRAIVATYEGGPISVLPPAPEETGTSEEGGDQ